MCAYACTYQESSVYLHVFARTESQGCFSMCTFTAESVAACVWTYQDASYTHASSCTYWELIEYLYMLASAESWAYVCMFLHVSSAWHVTVCVVHIGSGMWTIMCGPVSKAERVSACLSTHEDSVMITHVLARIKSWACIRCIFAFRELGMQLQSFARIKSWACIWIGWRAFRVVLVLSYVFIYWAVLVSSYVFMYWGLFACVCMCMHLPKN